MTDPAGDAALARATYLNRAVEGHRGSARLRPWTEADAPALLRASQSSPDLERELGFTPRTEADAAELIEHWVADGLVHTFAIDLDGRACGSVGCSHVDPRNRTGWMFYWVARDARGAGLASAGLAGAADWAFGSLGLFRLELGHRVDNVASCRVAAAAGFLPEGIQRLKAREGDERFDVELHARLLTDPPGCVGPLALDEAPVSRPAASPPGPARS